VCAGALSAVQCACRFYDQLFQGSTHLMKVFWLEQHSNSSQSPDTQLFVGASKLDQTPSKPCSLDEGLFVGAALFDFEFASQISIGCGSSSQTQPIRNGSLDEGLFVGAALDDHGGQLHLLAVRDALQRSGLWSHMAV